MLWIPKFIKKFRSSFIIDFKNNPNQFELPVHAMKEQVYLKIIWLMYNHYKL